MFPTRVSRSPGCINRGIKCKEKEVKVLSFHDSQDLSTCPQEIQGAKKG